MSIFFCNFTRGSYLEAMLNLTAESNVYTLRYCRSSHTLTVPADNMDCGVGCGPSFPSGSFPCQMGNHTFLPDAALVGCQACSWYRLAVASICGVSTESLTGGK